MLNRPQLFTALRRRIDEAIAAGQSLGVLMVRTHRVREFNLLFGYEAGERAAKAMHAAIVAAMRPDDEVHRIGECDFAVLLPGLRNQEHAALAAAKLVRVLQTPLAAGGGLEMLAVVAIGAAVCPHDGNEPDLLCRLADSACDVATSSGERFALYRPPEVPMAFAHGDLREAIAGNRLQLYLQPIIDLRSGQADGAEALSRWDHREFGAIPPDTFVRVAEQTGLIGELTRSNINAALRHAGSLHADGIPLRISVNISVRILQQHSFLEQIRDIASLWKVSPDSVVLEVTEGGLMEDLQYCEHLLRRLRDQGFGIAIDDFGTGYSSMAYLKRLPTTELKIDKSFVLDMRDDPRAQKLVGSMIDVSHHLGMSAVAEGVEDQATLDCLRAMGCDYVQGYHLGRPVPAEDLVANVRRGAGT